VSGKIELDPQYDPEQFPLPKAVAARLQFLLDQQDAGLALNEAERQEAESLVDRAEFLTILRLRSERNREQ